MAMPSSGYPIIWAESIAYVTDIYKIKEKHVIELQKPLDAFAIERQCATRLDDLIANFDVERDDLSSPREFLRRLADTFHSEIAFIAMADGRAGFSILHVYDENDCMKEQETIPKARSLTRVVKQNEATTVNEESSIDDGLREMGIESMIAVPFPLLDGESIMAVCNKKTLSRFGTKYGSYDVKICWMLAFFLSKGLQLFEAPSTDDIADDVAKEREAYLQMKQVLLQQYPGEFVGIYKGQLVASNPDKGKLIAEIRKKKGNISALICKVTEEPPRIKLPTSRSLLK